MHEHFEGTKMKNPVNAIIARVAKDLRTFRIALTVSDDECVLMDDVRVVRREDGSLVMHSAETHIRPYDPSAPDGRTVSVFETDGTISPEWIRRMMAVRANHVWRELLTDDERTTIQRDGGAENAEGRWTEGSSVFVRRLMRRLLGYHQTPEKAAVLCSLAIERLMDPELSLAIRRIAGWKRENANAVITAWDRIDGQGRQIGLKARPVQVACIAMHLRNHVIRRSDGVVGMLDAMPAIAAERYEDYRLHVLDPNSHEVDHQHGEEQILDLCELADLAPSVLRSAGVKPAFWRMALRMTPKQLHSIGPIMKQPWNLRTNRILNALSLIDPALLPPTLLLRVSHLWTQNADGSPIQDVLIDVLHRAAVGISRRRSRQSLTSAVDKIREVIDHVLHLADALAEREGLKIVPERDDDAPFRLFFRNRAEIEAEHDVVRRTYPLVLPRTRSWESLVAASDRWHADVAKDLDDDDAREWPALLTQPIETNGVVVRELNTAALLRQETRELDHCVGRGGYASSCMQGRTRIVSLRVPKRRTRSTIEFRLNDGKWRIVQHRGPSNSLPNPLLADAAKVATREMNAAHSRNPVETSPAPANDDAPVARPDGTVELARAG